MTQIMPADDCRQEFGGNFYRMLSPESEDFVISPGAVLKLLTVISVGANKSLEDEIHWDLYIKHVDEERWMEEAHRQGIDDMGLAKHIRDQMAQEMSEPIHRKVLLDFFKQDFTELGDSAKIENFIVINDTLEFREEYGDFMEDYFNLKLLHRNQPDERKCIDPKFAGLLSDKSLDLFGSVYLQFRLDESFRMNDNGSFESIGTFKYNELSNKNSASFRVKVLEIPLQCNSNVPLTMLVFLPNDLNTMLKESIGRDYMDFDAIAAKLENKTVKVKLPNFKMEQKTNLGEYFKEASGSRGLPKLLSQPVSLKCMFDDAEDLQLNFGHYWQYTSLELLESKSNIRVENSSTKPDVEFDATAKPVLFVIKSEKVLYIMGHYSKGNSGLSE